MITVTKEAALKMKDLGWKKKCVHTYRKNGHKKEEKIYLDNGPIFVAYAPTIQEILEELEEDAVIKIYNNPDIGYSISISIGDESININHCLNLLETLAEIWIELSANILQRAKEMK